MIGQLSEFYNIIDFINVAISRIVTYMLTCTLRTGSHHSILKTIVLDSLLQWAGVIDELEFSKRLSQWCSEGFSELGDRKGATFSETINQVGITFTLRNLSHVDNLPV